MFVICSDNNDKSQFNEYLATTTASILSFLVGIHTGWTSPFIPKLLNSEHYPFDISKEASSYIAIFGPIGDIFGEICSMLIVDRIGRKTTYVVLGFPMLLSSILIYFSNISPIMLYTARFLGGISMGTVVSIYPIYTSEISRPSIRGKLGVMGLFFYISGMIVVNFAGKYLNIQQTALISMTVTIIFLLSFLLIPETPYFLLMKKKFKKAEQSLKFFRRTQDVNKELISLSEDVNRQLSENGNFKNLFDIDSNRRALFLIVMGRIFQELTGATAFTMYAQDILKDSREILEPQFATMLIYVVQAVSAPISGILSDKFGRVSLTVLSTASSSLVLMLLAIYFTLRDNTSYAMPVWCAVFFLGVFYISFQIGIGSLIAVILGELFSTSIKSKAICVANISFSLTVIVATKFYQVSTDYMQTCVCFYVFALSTLIGTFFIKFLYPETKGKTLEEIQMELKRIVKQRSTRKSII
ncbi:hypothetical protein WA026_018393 [Henosepilachna vigintioctopunctata]|uniref:Major facilitator superfamily (MFS) profile domain-containing protein n=1 Tax=Henosepilachna vigintioctopunctata TaxID=420089 RepID=A0AAW1V060_9CUCU